MENIINEIADLISNDEAVYLHRENHEVLSHPYQNAINYSAELDYIVQEVLDIVDLDPDAYIKFVPLNSNEGYQMMVAFVDTVADSRPKEQLTMSLSGNKPFRRFRSTLEDIDLIDDWYDFRIKYLETIVKDILDEEMGDKA